MNIVATVTRLFSHYHRDITRTPHLERRVEFQQALHNYRPSQHTIEILKQTAIVTLVAPSGTGRNTVINELLKTGKYHFIISDTTRPPRRNNGILEQNGREYFFRKEEEVLRDIKAGAYVEAEIIHEQQVSGISAREVERAHNEGRVAITDVDIEGGINIASLKPDAITICMLPPDFDAWIARIQGREKIEPINLYRRLRQAIKVFRLALENGHFIFVINDKLADAVAAVDEVTRLGVHHTQDEKAAHELAEQLCQDATVYLQKHAPDLLADS